MRFHSLKCQLSRVTRRACGYLQPRRPPTTTSEAPGADLNPAQPRSAQPSHGRCIEDGCTPGQQAPAHDRQERIYAWRRRVLLKKGARMHAARMDDGDRCSLAILDGRGVVVAWYDEDDSSRVGLHVVGRHVSQFYLPADVADNVPGVNLLSAAICGSNTQQGWRQLPSGTIIWGTTAIEAIVLNDGRLQGFSHIVRPAEGPRADVRAQVRPGRWSNTQNCGFHHRTYRRVAQARASA